MRMSNMETPSEDTLEVMHLLEAILDGFQDEYTRPANQIALYEKYLQLRQTHDAKLIRHLIVIDGAKPSSLMRPKDRSFRNPKASQRASLMRVSHGPRQNDLSQ